MSERRIPAFVGLAAGTALVVASSLCLAQTPADPAAQALALFKEGVELRKQGKCAEALPKLAESVRLRTTAGTLLNVALCEESVGRLAAALQHYREVQILLSVEDERMTLVSTRIGDLEPRVPRLRVSLSRAATDARVSVDGQPVNVGSQPVELRLDAGEHTLVLSQGNKETRRTTARLEPGKAVEVVLDPAPESSVALVPPPPTPPRPVAEPALAPPEGRPVEDGGLAAPPLLSWISGGVGLVGLGVGVGMGVLALDRRAQLDDLCPEPARCSQEGLDVAEEGALFGNISTVSFAVGGAGVAAGILFWVLDEGTNAPVTTGMTSDEHGAWVSYQAQF